MTKRKLSGQPDSNRMMESYMNDEIGPGQHKQVRNSWSSSEIEDIYELQKKRSKIVQSTFKNNMTPRPSADDRLIEEEMKSLDKVQSAVAKKTPKLDTPAQM